MASREPSWDGEWIREAVEQYEERLILYAARIVRSPVRAQDVVQQTFLQLCQQDRAQVRDHLAEWLYTVCRNEALTLLRKDRRDSPGAVPAEAQESGVPSPQEALELDETLSQILAIFGSLPEDQQKVMGLKYGDDLTYRQIAEATSLSEGSVRSLIHRGLKTLRHEHKKLSHETES